MKILQTAFLFLFSLMSTLTYAQEAPKYGDFTAIQIDQEIVKDVVHEENDIYVKLDPSYRNKEIAVRISDAKLKGYRTWADGEIEKSVKIYNSNRNNKKDYTYRINTAANFVEYWIDEKLVLHLEKMQ